MMENNQLIPFERNRYYVGKLLTSADFQAEQTYGRSKHRFLNEMMFGSGIVCGLNVYSLDDLSVMIDSGVAVDGYGREVVLDSSVVRKLSAVDGFDSFSGDRAVLCLAYQEEAVYPVYAVHAQEKGDAFEHNRIREGWRLVLCGSDTLAQPTELETEFLSTDVLYEDEDYRVSCAMPARCACGSAVRFDVMLERCSEEAQPLTMTASIQVPAFFAENGTHELKLEWKDLLIDQKLTVHYWLTAQTLPSPDCVIMASADSICVQVGEQKKAADTGLSMRTAVVPLSAEQIVDQAASSANLETRQIGRDELVPLAEIVMQRTRKAYLIEQVELSGVRRYIRTIAADDTRRELSGWFRQPMAVQGRQMSEQLAENETKRWAEPQYAAGVCEIPLKPNAKRGTVAYSDEIIHGLGARTVFVTVGTEYLAEDAKLGGPARNTVYGNTRLFPREQIAAPPLETAVKVLNDRGSFIVAAQLLEDTAQVLLKLRWVAVAMPGDPDKGKDELKKMSGKSIMAVQPTVVLATRESFFFDVRFRNMEQCTLLYELTEEDSGDITSDGIYTAPGREGVFEIRISCADMPLICTYAYAVVKKKDIEQAKEQANA